MNRVSRGEKLLAALSKSNVCELTEAGKNYVIQRFDPYHDNPIKPVGYPDSFNGHTISRCIKKTASFTATSGGGAAPTTPWNCHIFHSPLLTQPKLQNLNGADTDNLTYTSATDLSEPYGGLMAIRADTDQFPEVIPKDETGMLAQLSLTDEDMSNLMRVTAIGFEFIDTTSVLNRQGLLTCYRQNETQHVQNFCHVTNTTPPANTLEYTDGNYRPIRFPPKSTTEAMTIPDTKQWKVEEGAYVVVDFNSDAIKMENPTMDQAAFFDYNEDFDVSDTSHWSYITLQRARKVDQTIPTTTPTVLRRSTQDAQRFMQINQSGIMLSGLNPLFSGTVNVIYFVECAPSGEDTELLTLCSQSPAFDPIALEIVAKLRRDSPIAVKLKENYLGEWFFNGIRDVVNKVMPWLSNAQVVGNQVVKWIDTAGTNDGYINPQSLVRGSVAKKIAKEKKPKAALKGNAVPKAPGPAPMRRAFAPKPIRTRAFGKNLPANAKAFKRKTRQTNWIAAEDRAQANALRNLYLQQRAQVSRAGGRPRKGKR